jgi:hypothetical protein
MNVQQGQAVLLPAHAHQHKRATRGMSRRWASWSAPLLTRVGFWRATATATDGPALIATATSTNELTSADTTVDTATSCGLPAWSLCGLVGTLMRSSTRLSLVVRSVGLVVVGESGPEPDPLAFVGDAGLEGEPGAARPLAGVLPLP